MPKYAKTVGDKRKNERKINESIRIREIENGFIITCESSNLDDYDQKEYFAGTKEEAKNLINEKLKLLS